MKIRIIAIAAAAIFSTVAHADPVATSREQQRQAFAAHEKVHAEELAKERAAAPEKLRDREKIRADFAAKEKVHAETLAAQRQSQHPS